MSEEELVSMKNFNDAFITFLKLQKKEIGYCSMCTQAMIIDTCSSMVQLCSQKKCWERFFFNKFVSNAINTRNGCSDEA